MAVEAHCLIAQHAESLQKAKEYWKGGNELLSG